MSNTVESLRRRMAAPCCVFLFLWVTLRKVSSCLLYVEPYYICTGAGEWVPQRVLREAAVGSGTIDPFLF